MVAITRKCNTIHYTNRYRKNGQSNLTKGRIAARHSLTQSSGLRFTLHVLPPLRRRMHSFAAGARQSAVLYFRISSFFPFHAGNFSKTSISSVNRLSSAFAVVARISLNSTGAVSSYHPHSNCVARMSLTSPQQVVRVVLVESEERHDKRTS